MWSPICELWNNTSSGKSIEVTSPKEYEQSDDFSAADASAVTQKVRESAEYYMPVIYKQIKKAANQGKYSYIIYGEDKPLKFARCKMLDKDKYDVSHEKLIVEKLKSLGYNVQAEPISYLDDERRLYISWKELNND